MPEDIKKALWAAADKLRAQMDAAEYAAAVEPKRKYTDTAQQNAGTLRKAQTDAEGLLWYYLRDRQLGGHKFRRQQPIGNYIADFVCLSKKLIVELDGGQHDEQRAYDRERDACLHEQGFRVLRFWNNEVIGNCHGVLERIYNALQVSRPSLPP